MRYFKVLYDFNASEAVELSVRKGDTVMCQEVVERDGWIKVEVSTDTRRKGFVPLSYLKEQPASATNTPRVTSSSPTNNAVSSSAPSAGHTYTSNTYTSSNANNAGGDSMAHNTTIVNTNAAGPSNSLLANTTIDVGAYGSNPATVVDAFMKNEVFFKQLMKQRQEALSKMEAALHDAMADVASCKDKNAVLARKLRDLDQQTERERRKWKERVEEEKLSIQRAAASAASLYGPGIESRTVRVTDTYTERTLR